LTSAWTKIAAKAQPNECAVRIVEEHRHYMQQLYYTMQDKARDLA
jgi:hypothetical protein